MPLHKLWQQRSSTELLTLLVFKSSVGTLRAPFFAVLFSIILRTETSLIIAVGISLMCGCFYFLKEKETCHYSLVFVIPRRLFLLL